MDELNKKPTDMFTKKAVLQKAEVMNHAGPKCQCPRARSSNVEDMCPPASPISVLWTFQVIPKLLGDKPNDTNP